LLPGSRVVVRDSFERRYASRPGKSHNGRRSSARAEDRRVPATPSLHQVGPWCSIAAEAFVTSTGFCNCPIRTINGTPIGSAAVPITKRLTDVYIRSVDCDFVAQYLKHLT